MRTYERNSVTVERCTECRGLFLDRGELERLIELEGAHVASDQPHFDEERERPFYGDERDRPFYGGQRRRRGFLGNLLDF